MTSFEQKKTHQVKASADLGSCQNVKPQRHMLHERKKNPEGEWKIVRSYEVSTKLGKGGFAKVYLGKEVGTNQQYAIKVVDKSTLEKDSFKEKLNQEIRFQKSLNHENVVKYFSSFEDSNNVYIVLEYCSNQTFKELLDRRRRLTEIEVKSHILQLINSLSYIHSKGIIHRDLKIANIFLNESMILKLADFGLSASIKSPSQKRRTICGTPNYIAPEVLLNQGHDFSVDNWAIGVIVYTFLVGKPPFEEKEVENTLKNIKANIYSFPDNILVSQEAKDFIQKTLISDPQQRMTLDQMKQHPFLQQGEYFIPITLPTSTLALPPTANFLKKLNKDCLSQQYQEQQDKIVKENCYQNVEAFKRTNNFQIEGNKQSVRNAGSFSPQDHHQKNDNNQLQRYRSQDNFPKYIQEAKQSRLTAEEEKQQPCSNPLRTLQHHDCLNLNNQEIPDKKSQTQGESNIIICDSASQNICPRTSSSSVLKRPPLIQRGTNQGSSAKNNIKMHNSIHKDQNHQLPENNLFNRTAKIPKLQNDQQQVNQLASKNKNIYLFDYIDCCSKFGLAYYLNNGTVGILLNNQQIVQIVGNEFEHISKGQDGISIKQSHQFSCVPENIVQNFRLVLGIKDYFISKYKDLSLSEQPLEGDFERSVYLKKYTVTKKAQLFRFSNNDFQAVFVDKSEIVITSAEKNLYFKDKSSCLRFYSLKERTDLPTEILKRVNYIKDILQSKTQKENKINTEQQQNILKILTNSPMTQANLVTQDVSQTIHLNQRMKKNLEHPNSINQAYTPFGNSIHNNNNKQNTTMSTNHSCSTQQQTPCEVAMNAPKNQQFISKLNLCGSMKIKTSPGPFQSSNLKPTSSLGFSVNPQIIK